MSDWREPVIDRTAADTKNVDADALTYQKGALNADDLNRIEDNYHWLMDELGKEGYYNAHENRNYTEKTYEEVGGSVVAMERTYTDWQEQNIPWLSEMNRIRRNLNNLTVSFLKRLDLPVLLESGFLYYTEVNDWERIELAGKETLENMKAGYRYCGVTETGGERLL